jgi:hypothetical protein
VHVFILPAEEYQHIHVISISLSVAPCFVFCTICGNVSKSSASDETLLGLEPELLHCVVSGSFKFLKLKSLKWYYVVFFLHMAYQVTDESLLLRNVFVQPSGCNKTANLVLVKRDHSIASNFSDILLHILRGLI